MDPSLPRLPVFMALLLGFAQATWATQVSYCGGICPEFNVLATKTGYEEREYDPVEWMCTEVGGTSYSEVMSARNKLQNFRNHHKEEGADLNEETWPGVVVVKEINNVEEYKMCWLIPPWVTGLYPYDGVTVESFPRIMFVRTFGKTPSIENGKQNAEALRQDLGTEDYDHHLYFGVGYDSYFAFTHHNEIWIPKN